VSEGLTTQPSPLLFPAGNAFAVYPASPLKSAAIVTMVVDQLTAFGLFVHPLCVLWEKLLRIHYKPNWVKLPARIPVGEKPDLLVGTMPPTALSYGIALPVAFKLGCGFQVGSS
jgi:hypothetical protein